MAFIPFPSVYYKHDGMFMERSQESILEEQISLSAVEL